MDGIDGIDDPAAARPLRDVLAEVVNGGPGRDAALADPAAFLRAAGHGDLPPELVTEAVVHHAASAPLPVAEHLASFVVAHGPVDGDPVDLDTEPPSALDALDALGSYSVVEPDGLDDELAFGVGGSELSAVAAEPDDELDELDALALTGGGEPALDQRSELDSPAGFELTDDDHDVVDPDIDDIDDIDDLDVDGV
jgi:hypothetical protein